jgi:hypothetical protein
VSRQTLRFYRKRIIGGLKTVTCLDGLPVQPLDQRSALAFLQGGPQTLNPKPQTAAPLSVSCRDVPPLERRPPNS